MAPCPELEAHQKGCRRPLFLVPDRWAELLAAECPLPAGRAGQMVQPGHPR